MPDKLGTLGIAEHTFTVIDATFSGKLARTGPMEWFIEVNTEEKECEGELCSPRAYLERYPSKARSMADFIASPIIIEDGAAFCDHHILPACRLCCLYVFEHNYLEGNHIQFKKGIRSGFKLSWTAKCAAHWMTEQGEMLDVKIKTDVDFLGLWLEADNERDSKKLLANNFEVKGLKFHKEPAQEGSYFLP